MKADNPQYRSGPGFVACTKHTAGADFLGGCPYCASEKPAPAPPLTFEKELESLLNRYSQENASNTPDFILSGYLLACLRAFNETSLAREKWYGKSLHI